MTSQHSRNKVSEIVSDFYPGMEFTSESLISILKVESYRDIPEKKQFPHMFRILIKKGIIKKVGRAQWFGSRGNSITVYAKR